MAGASEVPWDSPKLRAVLASTFVLPLGVSLLSPVLPVIRDELALADARVSLLISVYFVPGVLLSPVIGLLADRYGRRRVLLPSLVAYGLTGGAMAAVDDFTWLLGLRLLQGAASTGVFVLTVTFLTDAFEGLQRNAVLGVNGAALFSGAALFPFVGGVLAAVDWHAPFLTYLLALPVAAYTAGRLDDPPIIEPRTGPSYLRGAAAALPAVEAVALYGATFVLEAVAFGAVLTAFPLVLDAEFAASSVVTGAVVTVSMTVSAAVSAKNGALARRWSNHRLVAFSFLCYGAGLFLAWLGPSVLAVAAGAAVVGAGFGLARPSVDAAIGRLAPREYRAGALSLRTATSFLGRAGGPLAFTGAAAVTGYGPPLFAAALATLLLGAVALRVTGSGRVPADEPAGH